MVSLLLQYNRHREIPQEIHPNHLDFIKRFLEYHPDKRRNICFLDGVLAPGIDPQHVQCIHCNEETADALIQTHFNAPGRLFALVHPNRSAAWLARADYLYVTHVNTSDPHAVTVEPHDTHYFSIGTWPWKESTRSVWFRKAL